MIVELAGAFRDSRTGKTIDEGLIRVMIRQHGACKQLGMERIPVGQCRPDRGEVVLFPFYDLTDRERKDIIEWTKELMNDYQRASTNA